MGQINLDIHEEALSKGLGRMAMELTIEDVSEGASLSMNGLHRSTILI